jgi:hypothetical protein
MRAARNIVSVILMLTIVAMGLPVYHSADINRDTNIGLDDVILSVRNLARSAEDPAVFSISIENAISALQVTAGLKTVIKPVRDSNSANGLAALDLKYVSSCMSYGNPFNNTVNVWEIKYNPLKSIENSPAKPPPRHIA